MDRVLADKLEHDTNFQRKLAKLVSNYIDAGTKTLNYYIDEFDTAHDVFNCYARLTREDLEKLDRGHPRRFIMPMTATQITTMTTFIAQVLYGGQSPHVVDARHEADEQIADLVNQLLIWNATQQPTYLIGYLWIQDIITYNRGIMYEEWSPIEEVEFEEVEVPDPTAAPEQVSETDDEGNPTFDYEPVLHPAGFQQVDETTGEPQFNAVARMTSTQPTYKKFKKVKNTVGGFVKFYVVSPYDFICDPMMPLYRQDEMRYMGHRVMIPWMDLYERSRLPIDDMRYVSPTAVERLKKKARNNAIIPSEMTQAGLGSAGFMSRTRYDRVRSSVPGQAIVADNKDGGVVDTMILWVKLIPTQYDFDESDDVEFYNIEVGNGKEVLAVNQGPYKHDRFPYSIAEGRPSAHYQFSPGWPGIIKGLQDQGDYLKDKHQEALARTTGNLFIYNPLKVDFEDFMNPNKIGLGIAIKPDEADSVSKLDDVIKQVPIVDYTKDFAQEMEQMFQFAETTTAANSAMQGEPDGHDIPATTSASAQQMAAGRLTSTARMISMQALVPQTVRVTKDFQQFLPDNTVIRIRGDDAEYRPQFKDKKSISLSRDMIQMQFDVEPHDGTMPGVDAKAVAAVTRLIEASQSPLVAQIFAPNVPGNLDMKALVLYASRKSGVPIDNFIISADTAAKNAAQMQGQPGMPPPQIPAGQPPQPAPTVQLPGDRTQVGGGLSLPDATPASIPSASPPQIRPQNA